MKLLEGKTVLVTGGSTGIGRAAAIGAAQHGANVAINYVSSDDKAQSCIAEIEALGQRGIAIKGDVALPETATIAQRQLGVDQHFADVASERRHSRCLLGISRVVAQHAAQHRSPRRGRCRSIRR